MARILRVSLVGQMPSGEEWSVNPCFSVGGDFGAPVSSTQAQTIATAIAGLIIPTGVLNMQSSSTTHTGVRVEARDLDGSLESLAEAVRALPVGGSGASFHPFQTSAVTSLRTALPGASGRGRLYWPATGVTLTVGTLRPSTANVVSHLAGVKTYLSSIETSIEATLTGVALVVWSRKLLAQNVVTSLQMGDVLDVQRRRRDQLVEGYSTTTWP